MLKEIRLDVTKSHEFCHNYILNETGVLPEIDSIIINISKDKIMDMANDILNQLKNNNNDINLKLLKDTKFYYDDEDKLVMDFIPKLILGKTFVILFGSMINIHNNSIEWNYDYDEENEKEKKKKPTEIYELFIYRTVDINQNIYELIKSYNCPKETKDGKLSIIMMQGNTISTNSFPLKKMDIDLETNYNDDLIPFHEMMLDTLKEDSKGLYLFYGTPGGGKTTYIKYLISLIDKEFIFLPPNMTNALSDPSFTSFMFSNQNAILVIEDAENVLHKRVAGASQSMANLLNIADGLLSELLKIKIICTFNSPLTDVDDALQRKGRLTGSYEFNKLTLEKSKALAVKLGVAKDEDITEPMILTDIINYGDKSYKKETKSVGFSFN